MPSDLENMIDYEITRGQPQPLIIRPVIYRQCGESIPWKSERDGTTEPTPGDDVVVIREEHILCVTVIADNKNTQYYH